MKALPIAALCLIVQGAAAGADKLPRGEWHNTDLRSLEIIPVGACVRLWLEERTYNIVPSGDSRFYGIYSNVIRAAPVGVPSFRPECKYPPPAENPVALQSRVWSIFGNQIGEGAWRVRAEPGAPLGDLRVFKSDAFETKLYREREGFVEAAGDREDPNGALFFRPPAPPPAPARVALEDTIRRIHGGFCLEVYSKLSPTLDAAREVCTLRQRMTQIAGNLLSISVENATEFDRVPIGFPRSPSDGYRRQRGVFFSFLGRFEKQQIPGNAVVFEEEGTWNVVQLWF